MKLVVMIPAYNEEASIGLVIKEVPRQIEGIDKVLILVIDDGSDDETVEKARQAGADYIIRNRVNRGLAYTFKQGVDKALSLGADIIVNTDADFQYNQTEIPKLIQPILEKKAEIVIGDRQVGKLNHMSFGKKYGNILGSFFLRLITGTDINDASSGFRAFSREAAMQFLFFSSHTYTHEMIIQAVDKKMRIAQVSVEFKAREYGKSKLISGLFQHIKKSLLTILSVVLMIKPLKIFFILGSISFSLGILIGVRYLYFYFTGQSSGHIQSLILSSILISIGVIIIVMGLLADLINTNRKIIEEMLLRLRKKDYRK
jgi:glycosyltransferase involved in cell wall biosynthesis